MRYEDQYVSRICNHKYRKGLNDSYESPIDLLFKHGQLNTNKMLTISYELKNLIRDDTYIYYFVNPNEFKKIKDCE